MNLAELAKLCVENGDFLGNIIRDIEKMKRHFAQRHYEGIASVISELNYTGFSEGEVHSIVQAFSFFLKDDSDRFDANKFEDACYKKEG
jgi:hypothetical protein